MIASLLGRHGGSDILWDANGAAHTAHLAVPVPLTGTALGTPFVRSETIRGSTGSTGRKPCRVRRSGTSTYSSFRNATRVDTFTRGPGIRSAMAYGLYTSRAMAAFCQPRLTSSSIIRHASFESTDAPCEHTSLTARRASAFSRRICFDGLCRPVVSRFPHNNFHIKPFDTPAVRATSIHPMPSPINPRT